MNFFLRNQAAIFAFFVLLSSCNTSSPKKVVEMEFNVDSTLVNTPVHDSVLSLHYLVPGNWAEIENTQEALDQAKSSNIRVSKILKNPSGTTVFSLTDVRQVADTTFRNLDENYLTVLNPSGTWTNVQKADFIAAGYQVKQYVMANQNQTRFKMLFGDRLRPAFQVDYSIIIDSAYALNTKTFESVIGSIKHDR
jgi:hypothetical protein